MPCVSPRAGAIRCVSGRPAVRASKTLHRGCAPMAERIPSDSNVLIIGHRGSLGVLERILRGLALDAKDLMPMEPSEFRIVPG